MFPIIIRNLRTTFWPASPQIWSKMREAGGKEARRSFNDINDIINEPLLARAAVLFFLNVITRARHIVLRAAVFICTFTSRRSHRTAISRLSETGYGVFRTRIDARVSLPEA